MPHAAPLRSALLGCLLALCAGVAAGKAVAPVAATAPEALTADASETDPADPTRTSPLQVVGIGLVLIVSGWVVHRRLRHARALRAERDALEQLQHAQHSVDEARHAPVAPPRPRSTDPQTGALTRLDFTDELDALLATASAARRPLALLVLDIDHFRTINDTHGHGAGDDALRLLTGITTMHLGGKGLLGRFGGDEFLAVVAGHDAPAAEALAERIRFDVVWRAADLQPSMPELSVSIGVAIADPERGYDAASLFHRADTALYRAKRTGRNRVLADDPARVGTGTETDDRRLRPWRAPGPED